MYIYQNTDPSIQTNMHIYTEDIQNNSLNYNILFGLENDVNTKFKWIHNMLCFTLFSFFCRYLRGFYFLFCYNSVLWAISILYIMYVINSIWLYELFTYMIWYYFYLWFMIIMLLMLILMFMMMMMKTTTTTIVTCGW